MQKGSICSFMDWTISFGLHQRNVQVLTCFLLILKTERFVLMLKAVHANSTHLKESYHVIYGAERVNILKSVMIFCVRKIPYDKQDQK